MPSDAIIDHMTSVSDQTIPVGDHVIPFSDHVTPVGDIVAHVDKSGVSSPPTTANRVTSQLDKVVMSCCNIMLLWCAFIRNVVR